mmetsp:Transcript_85460/g.191079  ORF Transcript_85460/g.191079 Transcript_85460/m.191079 type:complete len:226 (-) Transcript_85460:136-813(-)
MVTSAPSSSSAQKPLPLQASAGFRSSAGFGAERSKSLRLRSTPLADTPAVRANLAACKRDGMASPTRAAVTARTACGAMGSTGWYIKAMPTSSPLTLSTIASSAPAVSRPLRSAAVFACKGPREVLGKRAGTVTLMRSRPKATPPYTLFLTFAACPLASWMTPFFTPILEWKRSFQSCGTSRWQFSAASFTACQSARLNQDASSSTPDSTRNLASTEAFASSRRW